MDGPERLDVDIAIAVPEPRLTATPPIVVALRVGQNIQMKITRAIALITLTNAKRCAQGDQNKR
ncbi:MAG: hypothetical protein KME47_00310 [Nodosilinea sp. WJT8-NPBG4]|nr:hypothetical protein [Nodosilinea sp. WJT8-NPBG4]